MTKVTEQELIDRSPAPRVTEQSMLNIITNTYFHSPEGTTLTLCVLTLKNGFHVVGESACASPENFDAEIGMKLAYQNAFNKIWALEGYVLKSRIAEGW